VLLLDEPAAGMQASDVADRAYVLESGRLVTEGPAATVARDPRVIEAYLGT
jgi:branched-chain amino acid transport system ATP-binding protein